MIMQRKQKGKRCKNQNKIIKCATMSIGIMMILCLGGCDMLKTKKDNRQEEIEIRSQNQKEDIVVYVEEYLNLDFDGAIEKAEGEIKSEHKEEYAYLKMKVSSGYEQQITDLLIDQYGESQNIDSFLVPGYAGHDYAQEIKDGKIISIFFDMRSAKHAKTRSVELYLVEYDGVTYLYFMG